MSNVQEESLQNFLLLNSSRSRESVHIKAIKHGLTKHPLYKIWSSMKERCYKKHHRLYDRYGGRGVKVCDAWKDDFKCFYDWSITNGWKKGLQLDKDIKALLIGVEPLLYSPEWCAFVTPKKNSNYRKGTLYVYHKGIKSSFQELCDLYSIDKGTLRDRLKMGMTLDDALSKKKYARCK